MALSVQVAEVAAPTADGVAMELARLRSLDAKGVTVRTLSAQGESADSAIAAVPPDLLVPPAPPRAPTPKPLASAGAPETKDDRSGPHVPADEAWEQGRAPSLGRTLELPELPGRRSPSPSRILPQPQGVPVSTSVAKAMAREAAQRVAESSRVRPVPARSREISKNPFQKKTRNPPLTRAPLTRAPLTPVASDLGPGAVALRGCGWGREGGTPRPGSWAPRSGPAPRSPALSS